MKWLISGILFVVLVATATAAPTPFADDDPLRLPKTSKPISYDLTLTTNVHSGTRAFSGTVKIEIEIVTNTDVLTLHNRGLTVGTVKLLDVSGAELRSSVTQETDKEFVHVQSDSRSLIAGEKVNLEIEFTGQLSTGTSGFYRSSYTIGSETR